MVSAEPIEVKGNADLPPLQSSVATRMEAPLLETPRSITVLDRRTLDDMGAVSVSQAHDYAVGMAPLDERGPASARGFPIDFYDLRRDGLRTYSWSVREPVALERIQYLRGPASILYGDGSPGGLVNLVLKKPLPVPRFELSGSAGGLGFGRVTADATGPVPQDRRLRYRVIGAGEWLENGYDNGERRISLLPSLAFDWGPNATVSFDTEVYHQRGRNYRHVVPATADAQRGDFSGMPWDLSVAAPDDRWSGWNLAPGARVDAELGRFSVHAAARYTRIEGDLNVQALRGATADGGTWLRYHYREISSWDEHQADAFASTTLRIGRVEHRIVAGIEGGLSSADSRIGVGPAASLDVAHPDYGPPPSDPELFPTRYDVTRLGLYATDSVRLSRRITLVPGLRWSRVQIEDRVGESDSSDFLVSPSLGVVVLPQQWLAVYSTLARGFEPPSPGQYLENGAIPALSTNASIEGGVKADLARDRLSVSAAAYRIERTNVPEADPLGFYRQIGEAASRGVEIETIGLLAPGLSARAGYAFTSTEITRDLSGFAGRELPNAPRHKAEAWIRYRVPETLLRGVMLAGGIVNVSGAFTGRDNAVVVPGYVRLDASGAWEVAGPRLQVRISAQNLTNRRYVTSGSGAVLIAGAPRRLAIQLATAF